MSEQLLREQHAAVVMSLQAGSLPALDRVPQPPPPPCASAAASLSASSAWPASVPAHVVKAASKLEQFAHRATEFMAAAIHVIREDPDLMSDIVHGSAVPPKAAVAAIQQAVLASGGLSTICSPKPLVSSVEASSAPQQSKHAAFKAAHRRSLPKGSRTKGVPTLR